MLGQMLDGRYKVVETLGSGGFGQTFVAEDIKKFNEKCVVKVLKPAASDIQTLELARRLFATEAKTLHELGKHNQIPELFASFEEHEDFYLIQEYIDGHPISQELIIGVQLPQGDVIQLLHDIFEPLSFVHQQSVIHRDIKPPNLMRRSSDGKIVLIDFGSVKQIQNQVTEPDGQTRMTVAIGTYGYMPTEQGSGEPELSSDIYAVGMIALQALTGYMPHQLPKGSDREICWRERVSVTPEFAEVLDKMIRYDCRQRYQSAAKVLEDLRSLATSSVIAQVDVSASRVGTHVLPPQIEQQNLPYTPTGYSQTAIHESLITSYSTPPEPPISSEKASDQLENNLSNVTDSEQLSQPISEQDRDKSNAAYQNGLLRVKRRDFLSALKEFDQAIALNPENGNAYEERGKILKLLGQYEEAQQNLQKAKLLNQNRQNAVSSQIRTPSIASQNSQPLGPSVLRTVRNTLTRPIEGPRTLGVTVFGPRGVGKTSLLAAMYDQFGKTTQGTALQLSAELVTSAIMQDYVAKLKSPFDTATELDVVPGIQGTADPQDFVFDLAKVGGPTAIKLHFKDFPGGRIGVNAHAEEIIEVKSLLESCAVVLVVIDAPAFMEENGRWHDTVNKPMLITDYFRAAYQNLKSPRLVLLVPSKCEKYVQANPELLLSRIKESYAPLLNFFRDPALLPNIAVAVTPVQTLGNITLTHIEAQVVEGQLHPRFYYRKTASVYAPQDSEQPLRFLLRFLIKIHLEKRTLFSKAIRSVSGRLFEDAAFKSAVLDFTQQCKTSNGFAVIQDAGKWLNL